MYIDDDTVWDTLLTLIVADFAEGQQQGIALPGEGLLYPVILGNKGDWSYLVPYIITPFEHVFFNPLTIYVVSFLVFNICFLLRFYLHLPYPRLRLRS
jgi:hypothetical protein